MYTHNMASDGETQQSDSLCSTSDDISVVETLTREGSKLMTQKRLRHSIKKYTKAYEIAESLNDKVTLQTCACNLGAALIAKGEAQKAIDYLEHALPQKHSKNGKRAKNKSVLADMHFNLGLGYNLLENHKKSIKHFTCAIEFFVTCEDLRGFAEGYTQLGEQYLRKQQPMTAAKCFEESAKSFGQLDDVFSQTKMLLKQGECLVINGQETDALYVANDCENVCEKLHISSEFSTGADTGKKARCFHDLGILFSKLNSHQNASKWYEAALVNMRSADIPGAEYHEARILENFGLTCNIIKQYSRAVQLHREAASLHGSLGNSSERGWCFYHLAEAYRNLRQYSDAERTYHVAHQIFEDAGQPHWQWKVLIGLGDLNYDRRNLDMAIQYYKDSLKQLKNNRSDNTLSLENHVTEKLVLVLQVQRAGMVRMASYKSRKPVLVNPELEKIVLESMSTSLQKSMGFEDHELPQLPTLVATDHFNQTGSTMSSASNSLRPLTYGGAMPSPILESPGRMIEGDQSRTRMSRNISVESGNHLSPHRKPTRKKNTGRRYRSNSFDMPVTRGIDNYESATDLSLVDSSTARELREARVIQEKIAAAKKKSGFKKLAKKAFAKAGGRRKMDADSHPENIMSGLESDMESYRNRLNSDSSSIYSERKQKPTLRSTEQSTPPPAEIEIVDETGYNRPSTSTGSYTTQDDNTPSSSEEEDDDSLTDTQDDVGEEEEQSGDDSDGTISGSDVEEEESEDEWDEDDDLSDDDDDEASSTGTSSSGTDEDKTLGTTYEKPMDDEHVYATIRSARSTYSKDSTIECRDSDATLYATLNTTKGSYHLPSTMPMRAPDEPPQTPPEPPASQRPSTSRSSPRQRRDSEGESSTSPNRESYVPTSLMTDMSRAHREAGLYELARVERERYNYTRQLSMSDAQKQKEREEAVEAERKKEKLTSAVCAVM